LRLTTIEKLDSKLRGISSISHRHDIDGLRGIAVILVVFYHYDLIDFSGGYLGVDVFFVISGWVITTLIVKQLLSSQFSFYKFYIARILRLVPALLLVVTTCMLFGFIYFIPMHYADLARSVTPTLGFFSNLHFYKANSYFDVTGELKPLQHTWSLSIEMQYYCFWPLFIVFWWRFLRHKRAHFFGISVILLLVSLFFAQFIVRNHPEAAFYLPPTRVWEFMMGGIGAYLLEIRQQKSHESARQGFYGNIGLLLIVSSAILFDKATMTPSFLTLFPTLGTIFCLYSAQERSLATRILSSLPFSLLGRLSYSWYLWHWPILIFARHIASGELTFLSRFSLMSLSLSISFMSWKYFERPLRYSNWSLNTFVVGIVTIAILVASSRVILEKDGMRERLPPNIEFQSLGDKLRADGDVCNPIQSQKLPGVELCYFGQTDKSKYRATYALYGDSHAQAISFALDEEFKRLNLRGLRVQLMGCSTIPNLVNVKHQPNSAMECNLRFANLLKLVEDQAVGIIVSSRWTFNLFPITGWIEDMPYRNSEGGREWTNYREHAILNSRGKMNFSASAKINALEETINSLLNSTNIVVLVYPIPEIAWKISESNFVHFRNTRKLLGEISEPSRDYYSRNRFVTSVFDELKTSQKLIRVKPNQIFCDTYQEGRCVAQWKGIPFYYDYDHLSIEGARLVSNSILQAMNLKN